jgi:hypothetical protein
MQVLSSKRPGEPIRILFPLDPFYLSGYFGSHIVIFRHSEVGVLRQKG